MMLEPLNILKSLRGPTVGASIGMVLSGVVYLVATHRVDSIFYAVVCLGGSAGAGLHGLLLPVVGPVFRLFCFCERVIEVLVLKRINLLTDKQKEKYLRILYDERYSGDDKTPPPKKGLP